MKRKKGLAMPNGLAMPVRLLCLAFILLLGFSAGAQQLTTTGKVKDAKTGEAIPGVSIVVKGTSTGVASDIDGNFSIKTSTPNAIITFSFVGYQTLELPLKGQKSLVVSLEPSNQKIDEVVVVGYGTQKKANLTGSVNVIKAESITGRSATSLTNSLQGTTPGVTIVSNPGDVGRDMGSITVRGKGNLSTSNPLFVIDNVISSEGDFQRINPYDIESISVLKDAAASAIYGSRAAYGVFIVTTKKGKDGKMSVSYNGYYGMQTPTILPKKLGSVDFAMLTNEANANAGKTPVYTADQIKIMQDGSQPDLYPNTDWYSLVYRKNSPIQEHSLNLSGGGKTRYYISGSFYDQESLIRKKDLKRYSFRTNTETDFNNYIKLGSSISYVKDDFTNRGGDFSTADLDRMTPLTVARHSDGTWGSITAGKIGETLAKDNPLRKIAEYGRSDYNTSRFNGSVNMDITPFKDLKITSILSYNQYNKNASTFENEVEPVTNFLTKKAIESTKVSPNNLTKKWETSTNLVAQVFATYEKTFGKHDGKVMVGTQYEKYKYQMLSAGRKKFPSNSLDAINAGSNIGENLSNNDDIKESAFLSQFGRFNYSYDSKYLFEANIRFDQSSKFHKDHRLGIFPSFSAGWRITQEDFLRNIDWLSNLKLRASWGNLGNVNNVGYYDYLDVLGTGTALIIDENKVDGVWPGKQPNPSLTWETIVMANIGFDISLFHNSWDIQVDLFNRETKDILLPQPQPVELGLLTDSDPNKTQEKSINGGVARNRGIEFSTAYRGSIGELKYEISGNFSKIWNKITDLKKVEFPPVGVTKNSVNHPISSFYMYEAEGLFVDQADIDNHAKQSTATKPGDIKYKDQNGDNIINEEDRTYLGNSDPYFTYGLSFKTSYKGFDLYVQGQGVADVKVYLDAEASQAFFNGAGAKEYQLKRWTTANPNPNAAYPRVLPSAANGHNRVLSSFWLYDASYFRIKSLTLGYNIPQAVTSKIKISNARVYLSASNPFTIRGDKRMEDFDPETPSGRGSYPNLKVYSIGINVTF
ncbi:SusC/RagA family TonB-linked outer membrane protein [Alistipes sp. ZOR0009]|uniref:SusC/RagA family TonB-linked outer membrane protein n=1 Tax=Alistipes sp. ZOR0009 TaxID=1339253 RepID=UPI000A97D2D2|nr:TonB-dependent receptor [Alistipes sp. ZOR0009]